MTKEPLLPKLDDLAATILVLASPGSKAKEIISAVREHHPGTSRKQVVQAAFYALTGGLDKDPDQGKRIQDLAIGERTSGERSTPTPPRSKTAKTKRKAGSDAPQG